MITKVIKFKSLIHPGKVYSSVDEFWADHDALTTTAQSVVDLHREQGLVLNTRTTLGMNGTYVLQTKTYASQAAAETCNVQMSANAAAVQELRSTFDITIAQ